MDFIELVKKRYSVRAYKPVPVENEKLAEVLEAARLAPTACNLQSFQLIVIHTKGREEELKRIYKKPWFLQAPIIICACVHRSGGWTCSDGKNYTLVDLGIAVDHLVLAATNLGLGTCWVGAFDAEEARKVLKIPADIEPAVFIPLGYPDDSPGNKNRKSMDDIVRYEHY